MNQTGGDLAYWLMDGTLMYGSGGFTFPRVRPELESRFGSRHEPGRQA